MKDTDSHLSRLKTQEIVMRKYTIEYDKNLNFFLYCDEFSEDYPTKIYIASGTKLWFKNELLHRETGPAAIYDDGCKSWYRNGVWVDYPDRKGE